MWALCIAETVEQAPEPPRCLEPDAKDHWHKFQLSKKELAKRILAIIETQKLPTASLLVGPEQHLPPGAILVRQVAFPSDES